MANSSYLRTYTSKERNMYMIGMLGQNMIYNIMTVFTSYYLQSVLLIPVGIIGGILVLAQVWDAINDPIMGTIVDRTRSKWGKCRPYLLFVPVLAGIVTMLCFLAPTYTPGLSGASAKNIIAVVWAGGAYLLWGMTYTAGDIPLWGVSALMTEVEKDRQKLQAAARIAAGIGAGVVVLSFQSIALAVGEMLNKAIEGKTAAECERLGFILTALVFTVIAVVFFQMTGIFVREKIQPSVKTHRVRDNFRMMWRNKPFRQLLVSGILGAPRNITMLIAFTMVAFYFASKDPAKAILYIVLIGGGLFIGMFVTTALVPRLLDKFRKKTLYNASNWMEIVPNVLIFVLFLVSVNVEGGLTHIALLIPTMLMFALKGVCLGLYSTLQTAMIADAVDYEDYTNNIRPDAVFFSGQTFIVKVGTGISNLIYAGLCALVGFSDQNIEILNALIADEGITKAPREMMQKGSDAVVYEMFKDGAAYGALTADQLYGFFAMMFFAVSIVPAIGNVLALIPTWRYALTDEQHKTALEGIQERRRQEEEMQSKNAE